MNNKVGCIYMHTCTVNGKKYIGQTVNGINRRWTGHKSLSKSNAQPENHFQNAIRKYGSESFMHEVLENNVPIEILGSREAYYIQLHDTYKNGYNSSPGGEHGILHSDETKLKMKQSYHQRSEQEKLDIANRISNSVQGSKNHKFQPWWYKKQGEEKVEMFNMSLREFADLHNTAHSTIVHRMKNENEYGKRGIFKNILFGYI